MSHLQMGGGSAMRAAAKIAGVGVSRSGLRGSAAVLPTEQSVRNVTSRQSSVVGVSSQGGKSAEVTVTPAAAATWDDWEFADDGELDVPRVVFGSVPTFQEAKEATTELKEAIDQVYLSHESSQCSSSGGEVSPTLYEPVNRSSVIEAFSNPSVPTHAIQAFQLLSSSREAQAVVASLACDPNVWNAVMENPAVTSFFQSQQTVTDFGVEGTNEEVDKLSSCASATIETPEEIDVTSKSHPENLFVDFMGLMQNVKLTITELVSRVSSYLQNIFPTPDAPKGKPMSSDADGNTKSSFMDNKIGMGGGTFIGLAVLVIMVIMTKRV